MAELAECALDLAVDKGLSAFFSDETPRPFTDAEIEQISCLLESQDTSWGRAPRTYIVLRTIGRLDLLKDLLELGFTDLWFPVEARSLPPTLEPPVRRAIVQAQHVVLTKSLDLEMGENGRHRHFGKEDPLPFRIQKRLGCGGYSQVDLIKSNISCKEYALKRIPRRTAFWYKSKPAVKLFAAEMQLIKALKHRHIVEFMGSFTDPKYLGMIMSPVAEMNLAEYMDVLSTPQSSQNFGSLRSFFGCLATAIQYLHDQSIRHRDIKPQNILIHGGNVLFTDFGLSKDYSGDSGSTTSGMTAMTPRYSAPEVTAGDPRNTSADIWSLGCVFLEMVVILKRSSIAFMRDYLSRNGTKEEFISRNLQATHSFIEQLHDLGVPQDNRMLTISKSMLEIERDLRPTAAQTVTQITTPFGEDVSATMFCGICCLAEEAFSDSHDSLSDDMEDHHAEFVRSDSATSIYDSEPLVVPSPEHLDTEALTGAAITVQSMPEVGACPTKPTAETQQGSPFSPFDFFDGTIDSELSLAPFSQEGERVAEIASSQGSDVTDDTHISLTQSSGERHASSLSNELTTPPQREVLGYQSSQHQYRQDEPIDGITVASNSPQENKFRSRTQQDLLDGPSPIAGPYHPDPVASRKYESGQPSPSSPVYQFNQFAEPAAASDPDYASSTQIFVGKVRSAVRYRKSSPDNPSSGSWWRRRLFDEISEKEVESFMPRQTSSARPRLINLTPVEVLSHHPAARQTLPGAVFEKPLHEGVFAAVEVLPTTGNGICGQGKTRYIPIVVLECVKYLKNNSEWTQTTMAPKLKSTIGARGISDGHLDFHIPSNQDALINLKERFENPPHFGLGQDWPSPNTAQDAASLLLYYLKSLGDPIIPFQFLDTFRDPSQAKARLSDAKRLVIYRQLVALLYPVQRDLLLYLLDFLHAFSTSAVDTDLLAIRFLNAFFRAPDNDLAMLFERNDLRTTLRTIVFLIGYRDGLEVDGEGAPVGRIWCEEAVPDKQMASRPLMLLPTRSESDVVLALEQLS